MAIDREKLIEKIKALDGLTMQERNDLIAYLREQKVYGLVWEDKPEDVEQRLRTELPVLKEVKSRYIPASSPNAPNHILIEGDNLEALTTLAYTHEGKIDVIYIDPPYNTGNQDFVYNDSYVDTEDDFRHCKWLSFMDKRLRIAKKLLSPKGVIFISIDDNEQAELKLLCDDIFLEKNFIAQMVWEQGRKSMAAQIAINHEYCLIYANNRANTISYNNEHPNHNWSVKKEGLEDIYKEYDRLKKRFGSDTEQIAIELNKFYAALPKDHPAYRHRHYKFVDDKGIYFAGDISQGTGNGGRFDIPHPITGKPCKVPSGGWRFGIKKLPALLSENRIHFGVDETVIPCLKRYLTETEYEVAPSVFYRDGRGASKRLQNLMGANLFGYPKDEDIIKRLLSFYTSFEDGDGNYTILDFFAGSGTTLHATMLLNAEDGGKRQCILVTNNENGICENVTYERNRRIIEGYTTPKGEHVPGLTDNNLRYYRTAFVGRRRTPQNMRRLMLLASDMLCIKENIYTELDDFGGMNTIENGFRYFANDEQQMLIIYDETAIYKIVDALLDMQVEKKITTYVFSPANDPWRSEFADVADKVNLTALPAAIYNAYKRVLPKPDFDCQKEETDHEETESLGGLFITAEEGGEA